MTPDDVERIAAKGTGTGKEEVEGDKPKKQKMFNSPESTKLISKLSEGRVEGEGSGAGAAVGGSSDRGSDAVEISKVDGKKTEEKRGNGRMDMFISKVIRPSLLFLLCPFTFTVFSFHHILASSFIFNLLLFACFIIFKRNSPPIIFTTT